jgi:hypothetical protein
MVGLAFVKPVPSPIVDGGVGRMIGRRERFSRAKVSLVL